MKRILCALVLLGGAATPALAATSPFAGSWKLDPAKSKFTGDTMTYAKTASGFRFSNGSTVSYDFAIDGKAHPTVADRTTTWTQTPDGFDIVNKAGDKVLSKTHRTISSDGKTMRSDYAEYMPNGQVVKESDVYTRVSGTKGLAGKWRDVKADVTSETLVIKTPGPGRYELSYPREQQMAAGSTDGAPAPFKGPTVPAGFMISYKAVSPAKWDYKSMLKGKVYQEGEMTVSADGKTLTDTSWIPGKKFEASVSVYNKG